MKIKFHDLDPIQAKNVLSLTAKELGKMSKSEVIDKFELLRKILFSEIHQRKEENEKQKQEKINQGSNRPSSKEPEWKKKSPTEKKKSKKKKKRAGSGNKDKQSLQPDCSNLNPLSKCPKCTKDLSEDKVLGEISRIIEDISSPPEKSIVSEEIQERKWCSDCQKMVSSVTEKALPKSDIGLESVIMMTYLWVVAALSFPNIQKYFSHFKAIKISTSGISKMMIRVSSILQPVYDEILKDVKVGSTIWADETGWRIKGKLWWLWVFGNDRSAYYWPDKSRGNFVVEMILGPIFFGVLITDAWGAYNKIICDKQTCMAHIFRKIKGFIKEFPQYRSILSFFIKLRKIIKDGEKLQKSRKGHGEKVFQRRLKSLKKRLENILNWRNPNSVLVEVIKKVRRQQKGILTFVEYEGVPSHNNFAEYLIRKGVLKRKISGGSMSVEGARSYACLQSIAQTCLLRGIPFHHFLKTTLIQYIKFGKPMLFSEYEGRMEYKKKVA